MKKILMIAALANFAWSASAQAQAASLSEAIVQAIEDVNLSQFMQVISLEKKLGTLTKPAVTQYLGLAQAKLQSLTNRIAKRDAQIQKAKRWIKIGARVGAAGGAVAGALEARYNWSHESGGSDPGSMTAGLYKPVAIVGQSALEAAIGAGIGASTPATILSILYASKKYLERKANNARQIIALLERLLASMPQ